MTQGRIILLVQWDGYSHDESMWEKYENLAECSLDLLQDYYGTYPMIERDARYGTKKC